MARFRQILDPSGAPLLATLYREITDCGLGDEVPLNWFTAQGERPDILAGAWALTKGVLLEGVLPPTMKQMVVVLISAHNGCQYCRLTHAKALQGLGVSSDLIDSLSTDVNLDKVPPPQRAILQFALQVAQAPQAITDRDVQRLRDFSLSDGEILELIMVAAFTNFINTWSDISAIAIDEVGSP
ncbi:MAG: peroxidase-related enzyme [Candidatus Latescibacteria bacterium]|nr:peroxidase-related enzyme [Candidatus Latescibacterota bacterium]